MRNLVFTFTFKTREFHNTKLKEHKMAAQKTAKRRARMHSRLSRLNNNVVYITLSCFYSTTRSYSLIIQVNNLFN